MTIEDENDNQTEQLKHWLIDDDLKNSFTETLPINEEQFWIDLIDKYLLPNDPSDDEKVIFPCQT